MNDKKRKQYAKEKFKKWYSDEHNKELQRIKIETRRLIIEEKLKEYRSNLKCEICGESHPSCIDFHHKDPSKKEIGISRSVWRGWRWERILNEISKCSVLCSNCHKKEHWKMKRSDEKQKL